MPAKQYHHHHHPRSQRRRYLVVLLLLLVGVGWCLYRLGALHVQLLVQHHRIDTTEAALRESFLLRGKTPPPNNTTTTATATATKDNTNDSIVLDETFYHTACDADAGTDAGRLHTVWSALDHQLTTDYPHERVSGGIFLYPRQAALLTTLLQYIHAQLSLLTTGTTTTSSTTRLCETGFGAGHSLALFAQAVAGRTKTTPHSPPQQQSQHSPQHRRSTLEIISFDTFTRPYQKPFWQYLNATYATTKDDIATPNVQLSYVAGDSCRTVPHYFAQKKVEAAAAAEAVVSNASSMPASSSSSSEAEPPWCDILHGSSLCRRDNLDLVEYAAAPCGSLLTSTAMDNLATDRSVYFGSPTAQWNVLRQHHCITPPVCFQEATMHLASAPTTKTTNTTTTTRVSRDYIFAKQGTEHTSQFCIAIVTGKCAYQKQRKQQQQRQQQKNRRRNSTTTTDNTKHAANDDDDHNDDAVVAAACATKIHAVTSQLQLSHLCPQYQIPVP